VLQQTARSADDVAPPDFSRDVAPILAKYCSGCHNGTDKEGELSFDSFADLQKGGDHGAVLVPGRADASLMIRAITGDVEPSMPPPDNPRPSEKEIARLNAAYHRYHESFRQDPASAAGLLSVGELRADAQLDAAEVAAHATIGSILLNLDETINNH